MSDKNTEEVFTFEKLFDGAEGTVIWKARSLEMLLREKEVSEKANRRAFSNCFLHCMERAAILCFAAVSKFNVDNDGLSMESGSHYILSMNSETAGNVQSLNQIDIHRFNVVAAVMGEVLWHFYKHKTILPSLKLERREKSSNSENFYLLIGGCRDINFILRSADFVRSKIEKIRPKIKEIKIVDSLSEWKFEAIGDKDVFGWNYDGVEWNNERNENATPPPSFLTFQEFTDSVEGSVFLTNTKQIIKYNNEKNYSSTISKHLEHSFNKYVEANIYYLADSNLEGEKYVLSICCGTRFSSLGIGLGHTPNEGDELLGVFMTILVDGVSESDLKIITENIYFSSGNIKYVLLQNLARENSLTQRRNFGELEKQAQMLKLLEGPLAGLTQALERTQEDAQTLRSILYDPHRSIFAVAPLVEGFFEKDKWCNYGNLRWKGMHNADSIISVTDFHAAGCIVSATICLLFGESPKGHENERDIYGKVIALLESNDPAFEELRRALEMLLFGNYGKTVFQEQLKNCLWETDIHSQKICIKESLKNLKHYVFTPFKYSGTSPIGPMMLVFYDYNYCTDDVGKILKKSMLGKVSLFHPDSLPTLRYSDVLNLVSGLLIYSNDRKMKIKSVGNKYSKNRKSGYLKVCFGPSGRDPLFDINRIPDTFDLMTTVSKEKMRLPQGNFRKPLLDFASALRIDRSKVDKNLSARTNMGKTAAVFSVVCSGYKTKLVFTANSFFMSIRPHSG